MTLTTRKPTGKPAWPILLLAGREKAGKTFACAQASSSPLVGRTLWVGIGEDDPDELGALPGVDFDIVEHAGTYTSIRDTLREIADLPRGDLPTLLVVDSMTLLWDLIVDDMQAVTNVRAIRKAEKDRKPVPTEDVQISMDLWNVAKSRWRHIMGALRDHKGPVLLTSRLESVTVMDAAGQPTKVKEEKVKAEKSLPFDVGGIVEMPELGKATLRGVRSARIKAGTSIELPNFTVHDLWVRLGLDDTANVGERRHASPALDTALAGIELGETIEQLRTVWDQHAADLTDAERGILTDAMKTKKVSLEDLGATA